MASIIRDIKDKVTPSKGSHNGDSSPPPQQGGREQQFNILPHPAKSNDPADLQEGTGGLQTSQGAFEAFKNVPGPVVPDQETLNNLPPAKTREELNEIQAQLNK